MKYMLCDVCDEVMLTHNKSGAFCDECYDDLQTQ